MSSSMQQSVRDSMTRALYHMLLQATTQSVWRAALGVLHKLLEAGSTTERFELAAVVGPVVAQRLCDTL